MRSAGLLRINLGSGAERGLQDASRDVMARADASRKNQDTSTHGLMLGAAGCAEIPENRSAWYQRTGYHRQAIWANLADS